MQKDSCRTRYSYRHACFEKRSFKWRIEDWCNTNIGAILVAVVHPGFYKKYANVKLVVNELTTDVILSRLREGRIDAVFW
jgi:hypothetical protein